MLLITHNLGIIAEACDRVAVMYAGKIVEIGDAREVFARPQHSYTRELLRSTISLRTDGLHYIDGAPPDLVDPPTGCRFNARCPDAMEVCARREPRPVPQEAPGHLAACWAAARAGPNAASIPGCTEMASATALLVTMISERPE